MTTGSGAYESRPLANLPVHLFGEMILYAPYWAEGVMKTESLENDIGDAAYTPNLTSQTPYDW